MKRLLALLGAVCLTVTLTGCRADSREEVIDGVLKIMDQTAAEVRSVARRVNEAVEKHEKENVPLDLSEAIKTAENLKRYGEDAQRRQREVEAVRVVTDTHREQLAERYRGQINRSLEEVQKAREELTEALQAAEQIDREKTDTLRERLREAEAPFETVARQS